MIVIPGYLKSFWMHLFKHVNPRAESESVDDCWVLRLCAVHRKVFVMREQHVRLDVHTGKQKVLQVTGSLQIVY
jgi:hypothetical protein